MRVILVAVVVMMCALSYGCEYNEFEFRAGRDVVNVRNDPTGADPLPGMPGTPCKVDGDCLSKDCANTVGVCR